MFHHDLDVWKKSIEFVTDIYSVTQAFPSEEKFGLVSQIRRAAVSIPSNIAEGAARKSDKEFVNFLYNALGSAVEIETQLIISERLNYFTYTGSKEAETLQSIIRMLTGLIAKVKQRIR